MSDDQIPIEKMMWFLLCFSFLTQAQNASDGIWEMQKYKKLRTYFFLCHFLLSGNEIGLKHATWEREREREKERVFVHVSERECVCECVWHALMKGFVIFVAFIMMRSVSDRECVRAHATFFSNEKKTTFFLLTSHDVMGTVKPRCHFLRAFRNDVTQSNGCSQTLPLLLKGFQKWPQMI